jgi:hypothetical protein
MFSGRVNKGNWWSRIGWLGAEIAVVFIGVYLAFLLEGYRTDQQNEQVRQQIYSSLYTMFDGFSSDLEQAESFKNNVSEPFLEKYENGEMPRLKPLPFIGSGFSAGTWGAMLQAGGIDLLDSTFILQIEFFFSNARYVDRQVQNLNRLSNQYLLPNADADIGIFYNTETKKIRTQYAWYIEFMKYFPNAIENMEESSNKIVSMLKEKMDKEQLEKVKKDSVLNE